MRTLFVVLTVLVLTRCVSPYKEVGGTFIKTSQTEMRSPFGTNQAFARLERCKGPDRVVAFYLEADFHDCVLLTKAEQDEWMHGWSQGQGGQVVSGMMNAAALGGVAAAASGAGNTVSSATSSAVTNITVKGMQSGHHK